MVVRPFANSPPVIETARAERRFVIDLFPFVLTDVGDDERAGATVRRIVETVPPWVAEAEAPDLSTRPGRPAGNEWVVSGNSIAGLIGVRDADIDAEHLSVELRRRLR